MQSGVTKVNKTEAEYIQFELESDIRHAFVSGPFFDMPVESGLHNILTGNLLFILKMILQNTDFKIFTHDTRLKIPDEKIYYYPDLFVSTEEVNSNKFIYYSAILVAEILSAGTRSLDQFDKFSQYQKIPQLKYHLLIEPIKKIIVLFSKNDQNEWSREFYHGAGKIINLPAINVRFKLADLYD